MIQTDVSRRHFLKSSVATGVAGLSAIGAPNPLRAANSNGKLRIGFVGVGGRGFGAHLKGLSQMAVDGMNIELAAVCDVYSEYRQRAADYIKQQNGNDPKAFVDFRVMYDTANLDAVCIGTPDHWHAKQAIEAMQKGGIAIAGTGLSEAGRTLDRWG